MSLTNVACSERGVWVTMVVRVAESNPVSSGTAHRRSARTSSVSVAPTCAAGVCAAAVLNDPLRRVAALGGRKRQPRSLGSVYGGKIARFLRGVIRGHCLQRYKYKGDVPEYTCVTLGHNNATLLATSKLDSNLFELDLTGQEVRALGFGRGDGERQFDDPMQVSVAPDGFVYVAEEGNRRVQVLTPTYDFSAFLDVGELVGWPDSTTPGGVVANDTTVFVTVTCKQGWMYGGSWVLVIDRATGALVQRWNGGNPLGLCLMPKSGFLAAVLHASWLRVYSMAGKAVRDTDNIPDEHAKFVCSSPSDELVLVSYERREAGRILVYDAAGKLFLTWALPRGMNAAVLLNHRRSVLVFTRDGIEEYV